jgi:deoxyribodipyrimidine photolyase-related protein
VTEDMRLWVDGVEVRPDTRFACAIRAFRHWAAGRVGLRMELFYRVMRRRADL